MSECVSGEHKTESPPKKRPKLSLKSRRKDTKSNMPSQQKITPMFKKSASKENLDRSEDESKILNTEDNQERNKEYVPPLTGLYNLGNTCYLNSVLQALRYCPEFSPGIIHLGSDIDKYCSKCDEKSQENDKSESGKDFPAHFHLVKRTKELLDSMMKFEDAYISKPELDQDVAVRPQDLLETLRDLNPMFQGYMQHDAQELLRCLLSHVQDASQQLSKIKQTEEAKRSKQHPLPLNGYNGNRLETVNEDGSLCETDTTEQNGYCNGTESVSSCSTSVNGEGKENALNGRSSKKSKKQKKKSKSKSKKDNDANGDTISYSSSASSPTNTIKSIKKKKRLGLGRIKQAFFGKSKKDKSNGVVLNSVESTTEITVNGEKLPNGDATQITSNGKVVKHAECQTTDEDEPLNDKGSATTNGEVSLQDVNKLNFNRNRSRSSSCSLSEVDSLVSMETSKTSESENMDCGSTEPETEAKVPIFDIVDDLFQGSLVLRTRCLECECFTERQEAFQDISVPVQSDSGNNDDDDDEASPRPSNLSLSWAISEFACKERLTDDNKYYCESCLRHTEAERTLHFDKLPQVFTVHLKRFTATSNGYYPNGTVSKVNNPIATPTELSLEQWCTKTCKQSHQKYQLFAVVMHSGVSSSSGHYITYIKLQRREVPIPSQTNGKAENGHHNGINGDAHQNGLANGHPKDEVWYQFDDEKVCELTDEKFYQQMSPATTSTCTPYLLFYKQIRV
ncbi:ubiquitin carboxyl-terminal hydrolase 1-like isoform X2 [Ptychodera flava]|uniref:ubiquitin carboxyl-terminal hydrolase 1-like isoform X2 n=1 Tax=Ptychodera flava TaxID=63121 RepID=UPI003969C13E